MTFNDQETDGTTVTVSRAASPVEAFVVIMDADGELLVRGPNSRINLSPGEVVEDVTVRLDSVLTESQQLTARLQESSGGTLDTDSAQVTLVGEPPERVDGFAPRFVEANPDAGFKYPYYLYAAETLADGTPKPILVQPNNTGTATDDLSAHRSAAEDDITEGFPREVADELRVPLLIPVFPRPESDPVDWRHYTHQLDRQTLQISDGPLERIDLQLLRMVEDAQQRLADMSYPVADDIMLNGFSASGNFVDRFTVLHPDRVKSVTAGGLNGMAVLPLSEMDGRTLNYQVGIADVEELTGESVDLEALDAVNQFLYMGGQDRNDTLPFDDAWTTDSLRETARAVYGDDLVENRFPTCQAAYEQAGVSAQFNVYDDVGHTPSPAFDDIVAFHRRSIEGEPVDGFGQSLGLDARLTWTPEEPDIHETVEFDATLTNSGRSDVLAYTWNFGDSNTAVGPTVTHSWSEEQLVTVTLRAIDGFGRSDAVEMNLGIGDVESQSTPHEPTATPTETSDSATGESAGSPGNESQSTTTDASGPGFGVGAAVTGLGGAAYALARHRGSSEDEEASR